MALSNAFTGPFPSPLHLIFFPSIKKTTLALVEILLDLETLTS